MQAHCSLRKLRKVQYLVHWFIGVYFSRQQLVDVYGVGWFQPALSGRLILLNDAKVLHSQFADGYSHPTILVSMVVNA